MGTLVKICFSLVLAFVAHAGQGQAAMVTVDFDDLTPGETVSSIDGVTITDNISDFDLFVATGLVTTSGANYLGVDDGGSGAFLGGDVLTFTFAKPVTFFSLTAVTTPAFPTSALTLSGGGGSVTNSAPDGVLTPTTDEFFVLTIANAAGFSSATLGAAFGVFSFNLDDLKFATLNDDGPAVPLPGGFILMLTVLGAGRAARMTARRQLDDLLHE